MRFWLIVLALVLLATSCGGASDEASPFSSLPPETTTVVSTTTVVPTTTITSGSSPVPEVELPGEPIGISPPEGTVLSVLGVRHDDVLNVRRIPGLDGEILDTLPPTSDDSVATGRSRQLPNSIWWEVTTANGVIGWVSSSYTAVTGVTSNATAAVVADIGTPSAATVAAIGQMVADSRSQGEPTRAIEMVVAPTVGDLGEVTFDVVGLGDDAASGLRLRIFVADEGGTWTLHTVESTVMCQSHRGGTPGQPCP